MKKNKKLVLIPVIGLLLSGCTFQDGLNWMQSHIIDPIKNIFNKKGEEAPEESGGKKKKYTFNPAMEGGTEEEQIAILEALNNKAICNKFSDGEPVECFPDIRSSFAEDTGDILKLTTKQLYNGKTVNISWECDESQEYFGHWLVSDEAHTLLELNYQGYGAEDGEFKWAISEMTCGGAKTVEKVEYTGDVVNETFVHDLYEASAFNAVTEHDPVKVVTAGTSTYKYPSTFDIVDYEYHEGQTYKPGFKCNNESDTFKNLYLKIEGKVIYYAPDGNWGLIADGEQVVEFYAGSGTALIPKNFPHLADTYIRVTGKAAQYLGNLQVGFVTKITEALEPENIIEPSLEYPALTDAEIDSFDIEALTGYKAQKMCIDGFSNSLRSVEGTIVAGSIKNKSGEKVDDPKTLTPGQRFTFQVETEGGRIQTVAYDYHTDRDGTLGLFSSLIDKLEDGGDITIKGTMRYSGNADARFILSGNDAAVWTIAPFLPEHVE